MKLPFEEAPMELCRQALVENSKTVELGAERFAVRRTAKRGLRHPVSCWMAKAVESLSGTRAGSLDGRS